MQNTKSALYLESRQNKSDLVQRDKAAVSIQASLCAIGWPHFRPTERTFAASCSSGHLALASSHMVSSLVALVRLVASTFPGIDAIEAFKNS